MFTKNAILAVLFVMVTGVMAADKPAVEARLKMEAAAQGTTEITVAQGQAGAVFVREQAAPTQLGWHDGTTKPAATALRRGQEGSVEAPVVVAAAQRVEHPVADVGYEHRAVQAGYESVQSYNAPNVDMGTKPAVRARNR